MIIEDGGAENIILPYFQATVSQRMASLVSATSWYVYLLIVMPSSEFDLGSDEV